MVSVAYGPVFQSYQDAAQTGSVEQLPTHVAECVREYAEATEDAEERADRLARIEIIESWITKLNTLPSEKRAELVAKFFAEDSVDFDDARPEAIGKILAVVLAGDMDEVEAMILDFAGFGSLDDALDLEELQAIDQIFDQELEAAGVAPSAPNNFQDQMSTFWTGDFYANPGGEKQAPKWFAGNDAARELFESAGGDGLRVYKVVESAMDLLNDVLGMNLDPSQAKDLCRTFFIDSEGSFDDKDDTNTIGRIIGAIVSNDHAALREIIESVDLAEVTDCFKTFNEAVGEWRRNNEVKPSKDKLSKEVWAWLNDQPSTFKPEGEVTGPPRWQRY